MNKKEAFWMAHIEAIDRGVLSTSAYAKQQGLAVKRLYYWQRKEKARSLAPSEKQQSSSFVALQVADAVQEQTQNCCTLVLSSGIRLEMAGLPTPSWLAALARNTQGAN